jgi:hypothetical protein
VAAEGHVAWKIEATFSDLRGSARPQTGDEALRQLGDVLAALEGLIPLASPDEHGQEESQP